MAKACDGGRPGGYTNRGGGSDDFRDRLADQTRAEIAAFVRSDAGKKHPDAGFLATAASPAGPAARAAAAADESLARDR